MFSGVPFQLKIPVCQASASGSVNSVISSGIMVLIKQVTGLFCYLGFDQSVVKL